MQLTSTAVYRVNTFTNTAELAGSPIRKLARTGGDPMGEFIIGTFRHTNGQRAVVMVNHNYSYTSWPTVEFDADVKDVLELSKATGRAAPVVDDSPELKGLQLSFGAGDGRVFLLPH